MHISSRRGTGDIILAGQFIKILLSKTDIYGHRVGILTITGICQRFPRSMGNINVPILETEAQGLARAAAGPCL